MLDLLSPLEILINIIVQPMVIVGLVIGGLVGLVIHWLFPESGVPLQALPAAIGFAVGIVYSWRPSQFKEERPK